MKPSILILIATLSLAFRVGLAGDKANDAPRAFERLKGLVGEWQADSVKGKTYLSFRLTSAGTALVERSWSDKMPEMTTVYNLDGDRLMLTHYCMLGNQPRMQAHGLDPATGWIDFQFLDASNLSNPDAAYMHNARIRPVDANHLSAEWTLFENGKTKFTESAQYTRIQ